MINQEKSINHDIITASDAFVVLLGPRNTEDRMGIKSRLRNENSYEFRRILVKDGVNRTFRILRKNRYVFNFLIYIYTRGKIVPSLFSPILYSNQLVT